MTHLHNIKNSVKTNEAHSQYCSNTRDYTIRRVEMPATSCSLGASTACSAICWSLTGCTRAKAGTWMYVPTEGGSGVQLVPRAHSHNPPTRTPTAEGTVLQAASGCIWSLWRRKCLNWQHKAGPRPGPAAR